MVRHIVMWTLKEEAGGKTAKQNAATIKSMLEALNGRINGLVHLEVGVDVVASDPDCHVVLMSEHDSVEALNHYQDHPEHQACVSFVKGVASGRKAVDYLI